jgi:hypothetical protein
MENVSVQKKQSTLNRIILNSIITPQGQVIYKGDDTPRAAKKKTIRSFAKLYSMISGRNLVAHSDSDEYFDIKYYEKFYIYEMLNAIYALITIVFGVAYYEFEYEHKEKSLVETTQNFHVYPYFITFFSFLLWLNILFYDILKFHLIRDKGFIHKHETFCSSKKWIKTAFEIFIFLPHPNPGLEGINYMMYEQNTFYQIYVSFNGMLNIFMLFRFYYIIRFIIVLFDYNTPENDAICRAYHFRNNFMFSLKVMLKTQPFFIYIFSGMIAVFSFGYSIRLFERELTTQTGTNFNSFFNTLWYVLITMLTVGYGDFYARTTEGRLIAMLACIFGVFLTSMMLISVTSYFNLSQIEKTAYQIMMKVETNDELTNSAKEVIFNFFSYLKHKKEKKVMKISNSKLNDPVYHQHNHEYGMKDLKLKTKEFSELSNSNIDTSLGAPINKAINSLSFLGNAYTKLGQNQVKIEKDVENIKLMLQDLIEMKMKKKKTI